MVSLASLKPTKQNFVIEFEKRGHFVHFHVITTRGQLTDGQAHVNGAYEQICFPNLQAIMDYCDILWNVADYATCRPSLALLPAREGSAH